MFRLELDNGEYVDANEDIVKHFKTLDSMLSSEKDNDNKNEVVPLVGLDTNLHTLKECIRYYEKLQEDSVGLTWKEEFLDRSKEDLISLTLLANYLNAEELTSDLCKTIAKLFNNKTPEEIREEWNLPDDLTDEEKENILKQNERILSI